MTEISLQSLIIIFLPFPFQEAATDRGGYRNFEKRFWYNVEVVRHYTARGYVGVPHQGLGTES